MCLCQVSDVPSIVFSCRFVEGGGGKFEMFECVTCCFFVCFTFFVEWFPQCFCFKRGKLQVPIRFQFVDPIFFLDEFFLGVLGWRFAGCCQETSGCFQGDYRQPLWICVDYAVSTVFWKVQSYLYNPFVLHVGWETYFLNDSMVLQSKLYEVKKHLDPGTLMNFRDESNPKVQSCCAELVGR